MNTSDRPAMSGVRKAAILVSFLGEEAAAPVLRNLSHGELQRVTEEISNLPMIPPETTLKVLEEYGQMMHASEYVAAGGHDVAVRLLVKAFGESGAKAMVQNLNRADERTPFKVDALKNADPHQLARFIANEHVQTKALILCHLEPKQASSLLMTLDSEARADCVKRMATVGKFSPEALIRVSQVLNRRFGSSGDQNRRADLGLKNLADMMNRLEPDAAREVLQHIEAEDEKLAAGIRNQMFTFENFLEVPDKDLRELMNVVDKKTLMIALKGSSEALRAHIYHNMSTRAVEMMKEDSEMMGPVRGRDVTKAQSEIVALARTLEGDGKIVLKAEGDDEYIA